MSRLQCSCSLMRSTTIKHGSSCTFQQPGVQQMGSCHCNLEPDIFDMRQPPMVSSTIVLEQTLLRKSGRVCLQTTCRPASTSASCNYKHYYYAPPMHKPALSTSY